MAKIGELEIDTIKFKDNSITEYIWPYDGLLGTQRYLDVTFEDSMPIMIWIEVTSGTANLYKTPSGGTIAFIFSFSAPSKMVIGDFQAAGDYTYSLSGGTAKISGAMKRIR